MVCVSCVLKITLLTRFQSEGYVKGYAIDWEKIKIFLKITDDADPRIDNAMIQILDFVDR